MQKHITIKVAEVVGFTALGAVKLGKVVESKACQLQVLPGDGGLALGSELAQDTAVSAQGDVDL